jgi:hypothetical protein
MKPLARIYKNHDSLFSDPLQIDKKISDYFSKDIKDIFFVINYIKPEENYQILINYKSNKYFLSVDRNMRISELTKKFCKENDVDVILCNVDSGIKIEDDFLVRTLKVNHDVSTFNAIEFEDYYRNHNYYNDHKKIQESSDNAVELIDMPD